MANHTFTSDILADALFRAGEATDGTSDYAAQALVYLNSIYLQLCRGGAELNPAINEDWYWLRKSTPGILALHPPVSTGTATVTENSTAVTLTTVPTDNGVNFSVVNQIIRFGTQSDIYRIAAHTSGSTSLTLDGVYLADNASGLDYIIMNNEANLASDVMRVVQPMRVFTISRGRDNNYKVYGCALEAMEESYPLALIESGVPDFFAFVGSTSAGIRRVRFNRYGGPEQTDKVRIEYDYLFRPTALTSPGTAEEPVLPLEWRHLLADYLLAYLFGVKDDSRAGSTAQAASAGLMGMQRENRYQNTTTNTNAFTIRPRSDGSPRKGLLRTTSGIILG